MIVYHIFLIQNMKDLLIKYFFAFKISKDYTSRKLCDIFLSLFKKYIYYISLLIKSKNCRMEIWNFGPKHL